MLRSMMLPGSDLPARLSLVRPVLELVPPYLDFIEARGHRLRRRREAEDVSLLDRRGRKTVTSLARTAQMWWQVNDG